MLIDLAFLISTVRLFHLFIQYRQKDLLNDFVLEGKKSSLISNDNIFENRSPDMSRGSLVVNDLLF